MMSSGEFDVENMSDDEFLAAWQSLATEMDKGAHTSTLSKPRVEGSHYTADRYKLTDEQRITYGKYAGIALIDPYGAVIAAQLGQSQTCLCGEQHEQMENQDIFGMAITVNGQRGFIPYRVLNAIAERMGSRLNREQDIDPELEVWE